MGLTKVLSAWGLSVGFPVSVRIATRSPSSAILSSFLVGRVPLLK